MTVTNEQTRMHRVAVRRHLAERAITLALSSEWGQAIAVNRRLIEEFAPDAAAWNRLGTAYAHLDRLPEASAAYEATLALDPTNAIAQRQRTRLVTYAPHAPTAGAAP